MSDWDMEKWKENQVVVELPASALLHLALGRCGEFVHRTVSGSVIVRLRDDGFLDSELLSSLGNHYDFLRRKRAEETR